MPIGFQIPREPRRGEPIDAEWAAAVVQCLRSLVIGSSKSVMVRRTPSGTILEVTQPPISSAPASIPTTHPFQVIDASDGSAKVRVVYGQVDGVTPTMAGSPLNTVPAPTLFVGSGLIVLRVSVEDGFVESADILHVSELPEDTETEGHITLAELMVAGDSVSAVFQSVTHSLGHQKCGETMHNFWAV